MMHFSPLQSARFSKGYTLLFAVLVSSIVLSIGISILTISKKEFLLASSAKDSTSAFYAADSGLECATYYNDYFDAFSPADPQPEVITCNGHTITEGFEVYGSTADATTPGGAGKTYIFHTPVGYTNPQACAIVAVRKYTNYDPAVGGGTVAVPFTEILSRGYNVGWEDGACGGASSRRVERALRLVQ